VSLATAVEIFLPHWATREFGYKLMKKAMSTAAIATGILFSSAARRTLFKLSDREQVFTCRSRSSRKILKPRAVAYANRPAVW